MTIQMLIYGGWFALLTVLGFTLMGVFAARLSSWLRRRPRVVAGLNLGAGLIFMASGISVAALKHQ